MFAAQRPPPCALTRPAIRTPRILSHKGRALAYTDEGAGPHVLLAIPGLPGSLRDFRWLAPALHSDFRLVRIELPGYGQSQRDGYQGMSIAERAEPVRALMEALKLPSATLLGHSSGGTVVAHLAHHAPSLVDRCVLIASNGPRAHYPVRTYKALCSLLGSSPGRALMRPVLRRVYRAFGFPAHLSDDERIYTTLDAAATDFSAHRENLQAMRQPTLVAWASDDHLIGADVFEELAAIAPAGPRIRFAEGGHNIQKTRAIELAEAIAAHCQ